MKLVKPVIRQEQAQYKPPALKVPNVALGATKTVSPVVVLISRRTVSPGLIKVKLLPIAKPPSKVKPNFGSSPSRKNSEQRAHRRHDLEVSPEYLSILINLPPCGIIKSAPP